MKKQAGNGWEAVKHSEKIWPHYNSINFSYIEGHTDQSGLYARIFILRKLLAYIETIFSRGRGEIIDFLGLKTAYPVLFASFSEIVN